MTVAAWLLEAPGRLVLDRDREIPSPGPGQVLIRVAATSVNYHDLVGIAGGLPGTDMPRVPMSDAVGRVQAVGAGVDLAIGARVMACFFPDWQEGAPSVAALARVPGDQFDGGLQTHMILPADGVVAAPDALSDAECATLGCAALTAWRALHQAGLRGGQTVVTQGSGGVALAAIHFAKQAGARVIALSSTIEKLTRLRDLGADAAVSTRDNPQWSRQVMALTGGQGADVMIDLGGGDTLGQSVRAARVGGFIAVIGILGGFEAAGFPLAHVMQKNLTMQGITVGSRAHFRAMVNEINTQGYAPVIDRIWPFELADQAVAAMKAQRHFGKLVISMSDLE